MCSRWRAGSYPPPRIRRSSRATRGGKSESLHIDLAAIIQNGDASKDVEVGAGRLGVCSQAPVVYVYGEVARGGSYRLEPGMT